MFNFLMTLYFVLHNRNIFFFSTNPLLHVIPTTIIFQLNNNLAKADPCIAHLSSRKPLSGDISCMFYVLFWRCLHPNSSHSCKHSYRIGAFRWQTFIADNSWHLALVLSLTKNISQLEHFISSALLQLFHFCPKFFIWLGFPPAEVGWMLIIIMLMLDCCCILLFLFIKRSIK